MLLAIDVGNTNTVFAIFKNDTLLNSWRVQTAPSKTEDEYGAFLFQMLSAKNIPHEISKVIVSSVVPEVNFHIRGLCEKYLNILPVFVSAEMAGVDIALDRKEEVGADRLVNARGVIQHYQDPAIVVDFGTATTFDVIGKGGKYCGGIIAPGINLSVDALANAASKLPRVSIKKPNNIIGTSTTSAMQSGIYWGYVSLIEGLLKRLSTELNEKPLVIATGGLASIFAEDIDHHIVIDQNLTLKGLIAIHESHTNGS